MLKIAIIGCGKIADLHAEAIGRVGSCEIVAACDREPLMAGQLADRFAVKAQYSDPELMLERERPDIVHITTPPQSHFPLARLCLEAGCHLYIEKPFAVNAAETVAILSLARERGLKVTAGHNHQFSHAARRMRALVASGYLGGPPVHMESYYGYELGRSGYAGALLGDKNHWVRQLPGGLLQNIISHGVATIAEFLPEGEPEVIAHGFASAGLRGCGEEIVDELRVIISGGLQTTAYLTFTSQMRPGLHEFRIFGPRNGLIMDQDQETVVRLSGLRRRSYLEKFLGPAELARQYLGNIASNARKFITSDFHMNGGMHFLIGSFYRSILEGSPEPISQREIVLTAVIMDSVFRCIGSRPVDWGSRYCDTLVSHGELTGDDQ